jgi:hypothetical protein
MVIFTIKAAGALERKLAMGYLKVTNLTTSGEYCQEKWAKNLIIEL